MIDTSSTARQTVLDHAALGSGLLDYTRFVSAPTNANIFMAAGKAARLILA
jgi:hypothetical protein